MARIAFIPVPEMGHLFASLKLARQLEARGHHVAYLSLLDFEEPIRSQGLRFTPIFPDRFPQGFLPHVAAIASQGRVTAIWREIRAILARARESAELAIAQGSRMLFDGQPPDCVLVDALMGPAALLAYRSGMPTALLHTVLPTTQEPLVPPLTSAIIPADTVRCRLAIAWTWQVCFLRQFLTRKLFEDDVKFTKRLAVSAGYPLQDINTATSFMVPALALPQIVLCPQAFDFPRAEEAERHYIGPMIDFDRHEPDFAWQRLAADKPLLYCSLGSQSHIFPSSRRIFQTVIDTLGELPDWQAIVATGPQLSPSEFRVTSDNVSLVSVAPQLQVLKRAAVMITHGGLASIKECLYSGVPMIVLPLNRDQPGNAARVVYHGLGVRGEAKKISRQQLHAFLDILQRTPSFKTNVQAMSAMFQQAEQENRGVEIIEALMSRHGQRSDGGGEVSQ